MGITPHTTGVDNVKSCCNLAMLCGNLGVPGGGGNPLRGQNNVQGACDMGGLPNVFTGYQPVADPEVREKFAKAWGCGDLSDTPGMTITDMISAIDEGKIKGLYVIGANPKLSDPDKNHPEHVLKKLDFLVVEDSFFTESAQVADVVFASAACEEYPMMMTTGRMCAHFHTGTMTRISDSLHKGRGLLFSFFQYRFDIDSLGVSITSATLCRFFYIPEIFQGAL